MKTPYKSYCLNNLAKGCKYCVKGEKLVLFISGKCSRNCWYCSLSEKRKEKEVIWANEREIKNTKQLIGEAKESQSKGAGITGGDPLLFLNRTLKFASSLKKEFGKKFHIHIYLPTKLVNNSNLKKLSRYIDEVRFHPEFILNKTTISKDIEKIKLAKSYWKKQDIGIELPMIPDKKHEILEFIKKISNEVGFINLNEFEISDTNFNIINKKYRLSKDTYTISKSSESGIWIIKQLNKLKIKNNVHFCTACLKNNYQYKNRLKLHKILPFGKKTSEGTVIYLTIYLKDLSIPLKDFKKKFKGYYFDEKRKRILLSQNSAVKLIKKGFKVARVEEHPTYDSTSMEFSYLR
ncbi:MAG: radical SAM protein [Nanoarchaeota archaeon]